MAQFGVAAIAGLIYGVISSLRGKPLIQNEASAKHPEVAEPVTQVTFPTKLQLASDGGQYQLVALGPRCVTFLRFTAYAIALYFHKEDLDALLSDKAWTVTPLQQSHIHRTCFSPRGSFPTAPSARSVSRNCSGGTCAFV